MPDNLFKAHVGPQATPAARQAKATGVGAFGGVEAEAIGQLGQSVEHTGQVIDYIQREEQIKENKRAAKEAYLKATSSLRNKLDGEGGYYSTAGIDAKDSAKRLETDLQKIASESAGKLSPRQREMFDQFWQSDKRHALDGITRHERKQLDAFEKNTNAAIMNGYQADIIRKHDDPAFVTDTMAKSEALLRDELAGQSETVIQEAIKAYKDNITAGIIGAKIDAGDLRGAVGMFEKNKEQMNPDIARKIKATLTGRVELQQAQQFTDYVTGGGKSESEALKEAREQFKDSATVREKVVSQIKARYSDDRAVKERQRIEYEDGQTELVMTSKGYSEALANVEKIEDVKTRNKMRALARSMFGGKSTQSEEAKRKNEARDLISRTEVMHGVDRGEFQTAQQAITAGASKGLGKADLEKIAAYYEKGGNKGSLTVTKLETTIKKLTNNKDASIKEYQWLYDAIADNLPEGQEPTDDYLAKAVSMALVYKGTYQDSTFGVGFTNDNETYEEAVEAGKTDTYEWEYPESDIQRTRNILSTHERFSKLSPEKQQQVIKRYLDDHNPLKKRQ